MTTGGRRPLSRRAFMARAAAAGAVGWSADLWTPARARAAKRTAATVAYPAGTTLEATVAVGSGPGYRRLSDGPGWPIVVREELAGARSGREDRRVALASIAHLTDVHLIDAQSPGRVEFLDRYGPPFESAHRAQETLTVQVAVSMIERLNAVGRGPVSGRPFDVAVSTGDNIDDQQQNEMEWFFSVLDGGEISPNSGDPTKYEGVQDDVGNDIDYWHPHPVAPADQDLYKQTYGFPEYAGFLDAAIRSVTSPGLDAPWYSTYGNHDGLLSGNAPGWLPGDVRPFDDILKGSAKPVTFPAPGPITLEALAQDPTLLAAFLTAIVAEPTMVRMVTADPTRVAVSPAEWVQRHLDSPATPGPAGHGYTEDHVDSAQLYYTFPVAPGVLGISLDTVNRGGYADGSLSPTQLAWLEARLGEVHARHFDTSGNVVATGHADQLVVIFSHHNVLTLENPFLDPAELDQPRVLGDAILETIHRFPNVVAWVNGHSHVNRVTPVPDPSGLTQGFWEVSTAAHVDFPEHARIVEIVDNRDGTLSIFGTIVDHAAPARTTDASYDADDASVRALALASISRELSANDPQTNLAGTLGTPGDLNVELLLTAPFQLNPGAGGTTTPAAQPATQPLAPTGIGSGALLIGGAAAAAAVALRRRG